jgi:hypothetical protein
MIHIRLKNNNPFDADGSVNASYDIAVCSKVYVGVGICQ